MSNILIINGAKQFEHSNGELNDTLTQFSESHLTTLGHTVQVTRTDSEYDIQAEIKKYLWADVVIYQMPGWWKSGVISLVLSMYLTQPGHPQQNAYVERFNRKVRYECLNQYLFRDLSEVQDYTTDWQYFYNHERPHMSVNGCPPIFKQ